MLKISINYIKERKSILEVSIQLIDIVLNLSEVDPFFCSPILRGNHEEEIPINISYSRDKLVRTISQSILDLSKDDIRKHEGNSEIDLSYSRDFGFSLMIQYRVNTKEVTFSLKLGSTISNGIGVLSNNGTNLSFELNRSILLSLTKSNKSEYGLIKVSNKKYLKKCREYKYPLGISTYFSNNLIFKLPEKLPNLKYSITNNGIIADLVLGDNFDKSLITEKELDALIEVMDIISEFEPAYLKRRIV